ncbi:MAG: hydroxylamine reductase [Eubacterium sp.]|nr:hydroxylamine reductase [Eubacterium sp.]
MSNEMYCRQCQETANNVACTVKGICGKDTDTAAMQDLLVFAVKALCAVTTDMRDEDVPVPAEVNHLITESLAMTLTNTNFDKDAIITQIEKVLNKKAYHMEDVTEPLFLPAPAMWDGGQGEFETQAKKVRLDRRDNEETASLMELVLYGVKGISAYMVQANALGFENEQIDAFIQSALASVLDNEMMVEDILKLVQETGDNALRAMQLLDKANTSTYGNPEVTEVNLGTGKNPAILISGHDLRDLEMLLEQTKGSGVDVYTHGEMLPAHYYPFFRKYDNFAGNYGNAWWRQKEEFASFNGPVLVTSNCIVPPAESYKNRMYTTGAAGFAGCTHIKADKKGYKDFSALIDQAKKCRPPQELEEGKLTGGFGRAQVMQYGEKIVNAVNTGKIRAFVVMAGCDGRQIERKYYTEFAEKLPEDVIILTAGCAKYRYIKRNLGEIDGIPRVLDAGQCNDCFSLVMIAAMLKNALGLESLNDLPIIFNISWYEQKAVAVLLALLSLGITDIHLGPTLPAFISNKVYSLLAENYGLAGIESVDKDLKFFHLDQKPSKEENKDRKNEKGNEEDMGQFPVNKDMLIGELLERYPGTEEVLLKLGMHCIGCGSAAAESLEEACGVHGLDPQGVVEVVNAYVMSHQ